MTTIKMKGAHLFKYLAPQLDRLAEELNSMEEKLTAFRLRHIQEIQEKENKKLWRKVLKVTCTEEVADRIFNNASGIFGPYPYFWLGLKDSIQKESARVKNLYLRAAAFPENEFDVGEEFFHLLK